MATEYTPNYNLDLYVSTDKPNLRDQYNAAMGKIDTELKTQHDDNVSTNNNISTLQTQMKNAESDIDTLQAQQGSTSTALEQLTETVDGFETQIAGKAPTNHASSAATYGAASLTQYGHVKLSDKASQDGSETGTAATPVAVSNAVAGAVDDLSDAIDSLQGSTAPKNHAAAGNTYGLGSETMYGHVKVTDVAGAGSSAMGVAASSNAVMTAVNKAVSDYALSDLNIVTITEGFEDPTISTEENGFVKLVYRNGFCFINISGVACAAQTSLKFVNIVDLSKYGFTISESTDPQIYGIIISNDIAHYRPMRISLVDGKPMLQFSLYQQKMTVLGQLGFGYISNTSNPGSLQTMAIL